MADLSLTRYEANGLELFVDQETGRAYAHQAAMKRMFGIESKGGTLSRRLEGVSKDNTKTVEIQTAGGMQGVSLYSSEAVFEQALEFCPDIAKKMGAVGANVYMCGLAGYKISVTADNALKRLEKQFLPTPTKKDLREGHGLYKLMYGKPYADRWLQYKLEEYYPALAPHEAPAPEELPSLPQQALLTPTEIARELGVNYSTGNPNPQWVNKKLTELGYQEKVGGQWSATPKAEGLCDRKPVDTDSRTQKDQLLWSTKIIDILKEHVLTT
ncbi:MAG: hypothetical protein ACRC62_03615 [Microcoleus sp.]